MLIQIVCIYSLIACDSQCGACFPDKMGRGSLCVQCLEGAVYPLGDTCVPDCGIGYYLDYSSYCSGKFGFDYIFVSSPVYSLLGHRNWHTAFKAAVKNMI